MSTHDYQDQVVWIVGASSGIGRALAHHLAGRGAVLALSARRQDELESLKTELGSQHKVFALDITNADMTERTAQEIRATFGQIDRVIFLAAAYTPMKFETLDLNVTKGIVDINLMGAFNLVYAVLPILKSQPSKSQLALCGSVAGYMGLPGGQPYSATKAAIINLAESLAAECGNIIDIKLINPGFVRTPLTDKNKFRMPMMIEPDQAAKKIADGLLRNRFEIHFPWAFTFVLKILSSLPYILSLYLTKMMKL